MTVGERIAMTNGLRSAKTWALVLVLTGGIAGLAAAPQAPAQTPAQTPAPTPPSTGPLGPAQAAPIDNYVVGQAKPPATPGKTQLDMSLDQAMQRALDKNLNLIAARYNPQAVDYQLLAARAIFTPTSHEHVFLQQPAESPTTTSWNRPRSRRRRRSSSMAACRCRCRGTGKPLQANFQQQPPVLEFEPDDLNPSFRSGWNRCSSHSPSCRDSRSTRIGTRFEPFRFSVRSRTRNSSRRSRTRRTTCATPTGI